MRVLVPNLGSTSLKFKVFRFPGETRLAAGRMQRLGQAGGDAASYRAAIGRVLEVVGDVDAVGFKAVHAGPRYRGTYRVDDELLRALEEYLPAAPLHNGIYLEGIRLFRALHPGLDLVAVLETGFHETIPERAAVYGVPHGWRSEHGIRRYGFHGASHRWIGQRVPQLLGAGAAGLRTVSCHLGGSSSICAIRDGRSCDVSMGFSPQSGLENATRHGDLDPFAVLFMMDRLGDSTDRMRRRLVSEGGLAGLSGVAGGDMRDIEAAARGGGRGAELALAAFAYQVRKTVGAFAAAMGGIDAVAFTGGIGENSASMRERICVGLEFLGIELDRKRNEAAAPDCRIDTGKRGVACLVVATQEELVVGREVYRLLSQTGWQSAPSG